MLNEAKYAKISALHGHNICIHRNSIFSHDVEATNLSSSQPQNTCTDAIGDFFFYFLHCDQ